MVRKTAMSSHPWQNRHLLRMCASAKPCRDLSDMLPHFVSTCDVIANRSTFVSGTLYSAIVKQISYWLS